MLGIGRDKLYDLMRSGRLRSVKDGRARFITASAPAESKPRLTEPYQRPCSRRSRSRIRREPGASSVAPYTAPTAKTAAAHRNRSRSQVPDLQNLASNCDFLVGVAGFEPAASSSRTGMRGS
jgi:hypothetical protein